MKARGHWNLAVAYILNLTNVAVIAPTAQRPLRAKVKKRKAKKKPQLTQTLNTCRKFIKSNAEQSFLQTWEPTMQAWTLLLTATHISSSAPLTAPGMAHAVRCLDNAMSGGYEPDLPSRFGYIQLFNFLEILKRRIDYDKKRGLIQSDTCRINASRAYDIYRDAQETPCTTKRLRHCRQIGSRWKHASRASPLLLLLFSNTAESFA